MRPRLRRILLVWQVTTVPVTPTNSTVLPNSTAMPYNINMSDDPVARFERAYWRAFRELDSVRLRQWEEYRLTLPQLRVLYHIRRAPGVTGGELAAALGITVSTVSGLVGKLAERGLIARCTAPDDRRQAPLELTEEGRALVGTLSEVGRGFTGQIAATLGDELAAVTDALEKLAQASERAHPAVAELR